MRIIGECPICHAGSQIFPKGYEDLVECLACRHTFPENLVIEERDQIEREIVCWYVA